jgi:uncharacterized OsmC-like protein
MSADEYQVSVAAGSLRSVDPASIAFPHHWTADGVSVESAFTGGHLLHLAAAGCVLNDLYREAEALGVELLGVRVSATGEFDFEVGRSTGISYSVELDSAAEVDVLQKLVQTVDTIAEIPKVIRAGADVRRR